MYDDTAPLWNPDSRVPLGRPFTRSQAFERGISRDQLRRMLRDGLLRRVFHGVYVDVAADDTLLSRAQALALVVASTSVVTDECAAWAHGVDLLARGDHLVPPPLSVHRPLAETRVRQRGAAGGRRTLKARDVETVHGVRVTTPLRTAVDLARLRSRPRGLAALDALQRLRGFTVAELEAEVARFARQRGVVRLRELAALADPRAESPAESVMRLLWIDAGLPPVTPQVPVSDRWGREIYRLDLGLPRLKYAVEYDGVAWHSSPDQQARDRTRRAFLRDREGWIIDVLGAEEVFRDPRRAVEVFRAGIDRARRRQAGPAS